MTTKHTPGPWDYDGPPHNIVVWSSPENRICFMTSDGPTEANARLIAAAPELLEVVKAFVAETVDYATLNKLGDPEQQHNVKWARSVIAEAEAQP